MSFGRRHLPRLALAAVAALGMAAREAQAVQTLTFAQFQQDPGRPNGTGNRFSFRSTAGDGHFFTNAGGLGNIAGIVATLFTVQDTPLALVSPQTIVADMTLDIHSTTPATATPLGPLTVLTQPFDLLGTITFTGAVGSGFDGQILLQVSFNDTLAGFQGSESGVLLSDTQTGDTVVYTSPAGIFDFSGTIDRNLSLSLSSITPALALNGITGFLRNFNAAGSGTFAASVVPEPATLALGLLGVPFALVALRRRTSRVS
jgi:hypothetical protein